MPRIRLALHFRIEGNIEKFDLEFVVMLQLEAYAAMTTNQLLTS